MQYKFYNNSEAVLAAPLTGGVSRTMTLTGIEGEFYEDSIYEGQCVQVTLEDSERMEVLDIIDWDSGVALLADPPNESWPTGTPVQLRITEDQLRNFPQYDRHLGCLVMCPEEGGISASANVYGVPVLRLTGGDPHASGGSWLDRTMVSREIVVATRQLLFVDSGGEHIYNPGNVVPPGAILRSASGAYQLAVVPGGGWWPGNDYTTIDFDTPHPQKFDSSGRNDPPGTFTGTLFPAPFPLEDYQFIIGPGGRAFIPSEMGVISVKGYSLSVPLKLTVTATGLDYNQFDLMRDEVLTGLGTGGHAGSLHRKDLRNYPPFDTITISVENSPTGSFAGVVYLKGFVVDFSSSPY